MMETALTMRSVTKSFGPVQALTNVDMDVYPGEVHAVIGENGAGKSTLMKILSGAHAADAGEIRLFGKPYAPASPAEGRTAGVAMIYQELTLAPDLSVEENVTLGIEWSRAGFARSRSEEVREALSTLGHGDVDPATKVAHLPIGVQQVVEIARALVSRARVVIMDEPTSSLSAEDTEALFKVIHKLRDQGLAIIYISHFLEEVKFISDRYTVMRDGESVGTGKIDDIRLEEIIELMIGRSLSEMFPRIDHEIGETVLSVRNISGSDIPTDVSFDLHRGEILGIAGLVGSGRSETVRAVFGLEPDAAGEIEINNTRIKISSISPRSAFGCGMDLLSEDRKSEGLAVGMSARENMTLSSMRNYSGRIFIKKRNERDAAESWRQRLGIKVPNVETRVSALSGGNQQKVAVARILEHDSDVIFLDEPTRGIDVGSRSEIARLIGELAAKGKSIVMVSSYLPELLGVCDTLAVMHRGSISPVKPVKDWTEEEIMLYATAGKLHTCQQVEG